MKRRIFACTVGLLIMLGLAGAPAGAHDGNHRGGGHKVVVVKTSNGVVSFNRNKVQAFAAAITLNSIAANRKLASMCGPYCGWRLEIHAGLLTDCHGGGYKCFMAWPAMKERPSDVVQWIYKDVHIHVRKSDHVATYGWECDSSWPGCDVPNHSGY